MIKNKARIAILTAVILAVGGCTIIAEALKPGPVAKPVYAPRPAQSSALLQLPDDTLIVKSDERTQACMANMACVRRVFLKWTFGNEHESPPPQYRRLGILKAVSPMVVQVVGAATSDNGHDGIERGLMETLAVLRSAGMPVATADWQHRDAPSSIGKANVIVFVSDNFERDQHGRFAAVLEEAFDDGHKLYEMMLERQRRPESICTFRFNSGRDHSIKSAAVMIPGDLPSGEIQLCFYQEIIQAFGPAFDFQEPLVSSFTDNPTVPWFSDFDYLLTRLFFHPLIQPGMSRDEVFVVFPALYEKVTTSAPFCPSFDDCIKELL